MPHFQGHPLVELLEPDAAVVGVLEEAEDGATRHFPPGHAVRLGSDTLTPAAAIGRDDEDLPSVSIIVRNILVASGRDAEGEPVPLAPLQLLAECSGVEAGTILVPDAHRESR